MVKKARIKAGRVEVTAELNNTRTADAIWAALPIRGQVNLWGDEIYFEIPVSIELENGQKVVKMGDLGYWPPSQAFCIFFGLTPVSRGDEIRPVSAVNVFGKITSDTAILKRVVSGSEIIIERD